MNPLIIWSGQVAVAFGVAALAAPTVFAAPPSASEGESPVTARLAWETTSVAPGETASLAVVFDLADHWHVYWKNPGESGGPIRLKIELPEGFVAGETQWPAPSRLVLPGDILDYVYSTQVALIVPISTPAGAASGTSAPIRVRADWLMCDDDVCVPGGQSLTGEIRFGEDGGPTGDARIFAATRERLPVQAPPGAVEGAWEGLVLEIRSPGASALAFFPDPAEDIAPTNMARDGEGRGDRLRIEFAERTRNAAKVGGVLEVRDASGDVCWWSIQLPGPGSGRVSP